MREVGGEMCVIRTAKDVTVVNSSVINYMQNCG